MYEPSLTQWYSTSPEVGATAVLDGFRLDVYRFMHPVFAPEGRWEAAAEPFWPHSLPLTAESLEDAKAEALRFFVQRLEGALAAARKLQGMP